MSLSSDTVVRLLMSQRGMLLGYIGSIVRDPELAEDLLQEVSILALKKGGEVAKESGFGPWVRRVARFECLSALRRSRRLPLLLGDEILDLLDGQWNANEQERNVDRAKWLQGCLKKLTPRARQLVELRYGQGLPGRQVAETLDRPLNTVYVALSRLHRTLAECLRRRAASEPEAE